MTYPHVALLEHLVLSAWSEWTHLTIQGKGWVPHGPRWRGGNSNGKLPRQAQLRSGRAPPSAAQGHRDQAHPHVHGLGDTAKDTCLVGQ